MTNKQYKTMLRLDKVPFFFIVSRPRSGTTLIQTLFEAHPNVCIPPEAPVITETYERFGKLTKWTDNDIDEFIEFLFKITKFNFWNIDKEELASSIKSYPGKLSLEVLVKLVYMNYNSVFEKGEIITFGDKNPRYSRYPEKLLQAFPEAKCLHLVRDYRDHILSMQRVKLLKSYLPFIAIRWRNSQRKMLRLLKRYPNSFMSVRYEDFVNAPHDYFEQICNFLNIPYDPSIFNYTEQKDKFYEENKYQSDEEFHGNIFKPINADQVGKWQRKMDDKSVRDADWFVGKYAELSGYERKYKKADLLTVFRSVSGYMHFAWNSVFVGSVNLIPIKWRKYLVRRFSFLSKVFLKNKAVSN